MSVEYNDNLKNARMTAVADAIGAAGILQLCGRHVENRILVDDVLCEFPLGDNSVTDDVLDLDLLLNESACIASGTAVIGRITNALGFVIATGLTIGSGYPASIILNSVNFSVNQHVRLSFARITHAD